MRSLRILDQLSWKSLGFVAPVAIVGGLMLLNSQIAEALNGVLGTQRSSGGLLMAEAGDDTSGPQEPGVGSESKFTVHVEILPQSLERYARFADEIARVRVIGSHVDSSGNGLPLTVYQMSVEESLKGRAASTIEVRVIGGMTERGNYSVREAPRFADGEEAILFLNAAQGQSWYGILGLEQGAYRPVADENGRLVVQGLHASGETPDEFMVRALDAWVASEKR